MFGVSEEKYNSEYRKRNSANSRGSQGSNISLRDATVSKVKIAHNARAVNPSQTNLSENSSTGKDNRSSARIDYGESDRAIIAGALESVAETAELIRWYSMK